MGNPAQVADGVLADRDYTGPASVKAQQTRLDEAWRALRREPGVPDLEASIAAGLLTVEDVVDVVCAAALRVLRNPEGVESESGALDDYQEGRKFADASQDLYFTAAEVRRLNPTPAANTPWAGSLKYC